MTYEGFKDYAESVGCTNIQYGKLEFLNDESGKAKHGVTLTLPNGHVWSGHVVRSKKEASLDFVSTEFYHLLKDTLEKLSLIN